MPRLDDARRGILMMVAAAGLWSLHDATSKWLAQDYSIFQILLIRSAFTFLPILVFVRREGGLAALGTRRLGATLGRGCLGTAAFGLFLMALPMMPLANVFAIVMSAPLFITALSRPILGEAVGWRQWVAVLAGFAAVLAMIGPRGGILPLAAGLVLASNLFYALAMMVTRSIGRTESAASMTFYSSLVFLLAGAATAPFYWITPSPADFAIMAGVGIVAGLAQYCMTQAFRVAPPATVAPFEYSSMIWAVILGFLIWGDLPTPAVLGGAAVIALSGLFVLRSEARTAK